MLKKPLFSPAQPWRAETRLAPGIVLTSLRSSTYPTWEQAVLAARDGRVKNATPPVLLSAAASLNGLFEHPHYMLPAWHLTGHMRRMTMRQIR